MSKTKTKMIVILIDGMGASYFNANSNRLPYLRRLGERGISVERFHPSTPATSMPGRVSMLTGVTAAQHGVYGNRIFEGEQFRNVAPSDIRVPTLAKMAQDADLDIACLGFAMVSPSDVSVFEPTWWIRHWLPAGRHGKTLAGTKWDDAQIVKDPGCRLDPQTEPMIPMSNGEFVGCGASSTILSGLSSDQRMVNMAAKLACSDNPPDLILTEICMPDEVQHYHGYESDLSHWVLATADALVGLLIHELEAAGRLDDYVIAVTSDHGHGPVDSVLYPESIIPGLAWEAEGATLHVVTKSDRDLVFATEKLAEFAIQESDNAYLPDDRRNLIHSFPAPPRVSFEDIPAGVKTGTMTGQPKLTSTHGFRPGTEDDDQICIFAGPGVPQGRIKSASAVQFAPTIASLLSLDSDRFPADSLIPPTG